MRDGEPRRQTKQEHLELTPQQSNNNNNNNTSTNKMSRLQLTALALALRLGAVQASHCCFWSKTGDACQCDAPAAPDSFCGTSADQCALCGGATWCADDEDPAEPAPTPKPTEPKESCRGDYSACQGCSGEQCTYCSAEQDVNCCVSEGGDLYECCEASAPFSWRYSMNECASVADKTPEPTPEAEEEDDDDDDDDDDDFDGATLPPTLAPEIEWRVGAEGESCDATCSSDGLECSEDHLEDSNAQLDFMDVLGPVGQGCTAFKGPKQNKAAPYINHKGKCFTKSQASVFSCSQAGSNGKRRLCACSPARRHRSSSNRVVASARMSPIGAGVGFVAVGLLGIVGMRAARGHKAPAQTTVALPDDVEAARKPTATVGKWVPKTGAMSAPDGHVDHLDIEYTNK